MGGVGKPSKLLSTYLFLASFFNPIFLYKKPETTDKIKKSQTSAML